MILVQFGRALLSTEYPLGGWNLDMGHAKGLGLVTWVLKDLDPMPLDLGLQSFVVAC